MSKRVEKEKNQNIQVFVRCRPLNGSEKKKGGFSVLETKDREVNVKERNIPTAPVKTFTFDRVYGANSKQIEVYRHVVSPLVEEVLQGYNCTVFAYGQTGTGKTYTMEGERSEDASMTWEEDPLAGIIPRAMNQLFTRLTKMGCEFSVRVSFLEIYNEDLIDLLGAESVDNPRLKIYEDAARKGSCVIHGLEEVVVQDKDDVYRIMSRGSARRQTAATLMNAHSSRSHSLFMVTIHIKENSLDGEELLKTGKLNLVDLAGSECIGRSGAVDKRAREAGNINQSLLTLGRVITALVEHTPHIPYRESKLTRLLQDSLGGRTKTSIIATISPASLNLDETLSTLDYAFRAKNITNRPEVNQKLTKKTLLKEYNEEIERLRRDLQSARDKNGIYLAQENYDDMQTKIQQQRDSIEDLTERININLTEMTKMSQLFTETKEELHDTKQFLEETQNDLTDTRTTLEKTRFSLQTTIQDRDEQKHLLTNQMFTETRLTDQANQLLTTADQATADVSGLHAKLDRVRDVATHNETVEETFMSRFSSNVREIQTDLMTMRDEQNTRNTAVINALEELTKRRSGEVDAACSDLANMMSKVKQRLTSLEEEENAHLTNSTEWSSEVATYCSTSQEEELSRQGAFHERVFLATMSELEISLRRQHESLDQMKALVAQHVSEQKSCVEEWRSTMDSRLTVLERLATDMSTNVLATLDQQKQDLQQTTQTQDALDEELAEKFQAEMGRVMGRLMNDMVQQRRETRSKHVTNLQTSNTDISQRLTTYRDDTTTAVTESRTQNDDRRDDMVTKTTTHHDKVKDDVTKVQQNVDEVTSSLNKLRDDVSDFTTETHNVYKSRTNRLLELQGEHMGALKIARSAQTQSVEALSDEMRVEVDRLAELHKEQLTAEADQLTDQRTSLTTGCQQLSTWSQQHREQQEKQEGEVKRFLLEEMRKDKPTGMTPQRRDFQYPNNLARTQRHSLLVQQFRRDYVLRDVTDLPIPADTSFNSQASEPVPQLNFDDVDDGIQNTSSDSAISSNSLVSSVAASDAAELDEGDTGKQRRSREDKENQMKPPETKGALRTKPRSRSRSGTRTPQNNTPKKTSKDPASGPGQNRPRTRVPLRSNNP